MKAVKPMDLWALWYYGDAARNIKPYRLISSDEIEDKSSKGSSMLGGYSCS